MNLIKNTPYSAAGDSVLDVGCAPGGWIQVVLQQKKSTVVGVDLLEVTNLEDTRFTFIQGDITSQDTVDKVLAVHEKYDCVISDAAPNTSGSKLLDHVNSVDLVRLIYQFTKTVLKPGGNFVFKVFEGEDRDALVREIKKDFNFSKMLRPEATRKSSFEMYIVFKGFKGVEEPKETQEQE